MKLIKCSVYFKWGYPQILSNIMNKINEKHDIMKITNIIEEP